MWEEGRGKHPVLNDVMIHDFILLVAVCFERCEALVQLNSGSNLVN